jgi:adenylosuccinate synthase
MGTVLLATRGDHLEFGDKVLFAKDLQSPQTMLRKMMWMRTMCLERAFRMMNEVIPGEKSDYTEAVDLLRYEAKDWMNDFQEWAARVRIVEDLWLCDPNSVHEAVVFEGAQGVLLDEKYGCAPYTTWTNTTFKNAANLWQEAGYKWGPSQIERIGVLRPYFTRHGDGPFPSEFKDDDQARSLRELKEAHNKTGSFMGAFRYGHFDAIAAKYAIDCCNGVDSIAFTHIDEVESWSAIGTIYPSPSVYGHTEANFINYFTVEGFLRFAEETLGKVSIISRGATEKDKECLHSAKLSA